MAEDFYFSIVNSDGQGFIFPTVVRFEDTYDNPVTPFALPGKDTNDNILISISGPSNRLTLSFEFQDLGEDKGIGNSSDVITIEEQIEWLKKNVLTPNITETYNFTVWNPATSTNILQEDVLVENLRINYENERPGSISASLTCVIGRNPLSIGGAL